jgi:hypothetical protein
MPERILELSRQVSALATSRVEEIRDVTEMTRLLAINASIEAARAGTVGAGFGIVAQEVRSISTRIDTIAEHLQEQLDGKIAELNALGRGLVANIRGSRLADLALNMIDIVDRNLYERTCDVRWWATDSAVVDCVSANTPDAGDRASRWASQRLGVILDAYTVYLDLWIADSHGSVLASGRPERYPKAVGADVSSERWFQQGIRAASGDEFVACDVSVNAVLGNAKVATYSTAIREDGAKEGRILGVLGIFFDWEAQSQSVIAGLPLTPDEKSRTRCLMLDSKLRVIASSESSYGMAEQYPLRCGDRKRGAYEDSDGRLVGFALSPGYETYKSLGWYGVLVQSGVTIKTERPATS